MMQYSKSWRQLQDEKEAKQAVKLWTEIGVGVFFLANLIIWGMVWVVLLPEIQ